MSNIWFISDTHFCHTNILKFKRDDGSPLRTFESVDAMNETIIENWNQVIRPQDKVWHLGDVALQVVEPKHLNSIMRRLNGQKRLILGNHDKPKAQGFLDWFDKVAIWNGFKEGDFTISHIPLRLDSLRDGRFNVHGHVHANSLADPHYINVSVEVTGYRPVHYDEIVARIRRGGGETTKPKEAV